MAAVAVETKEASFYNRFGQHIYTEPLGRAAGYAWPQFSIHRGDLQAVLIDAVVARSSPRACVATATPATADSERRPASVSPKTRAQTHATQ